MGGTLNNTKTVKFSVGVKLGALISTLLAASVFGLASLATHLFVEYNTAQIQQATTDAAASLSVQMRQVFEASTEKMRVVGTLLQESSGANPQVAKDFIANDRTLLGVFVHSRRAGESLQLKAQAVSSELKDFNPKELLSQGFSPEQVLDSGEAGSQVLVMQTEGGVQGVLISIPFLKEGEHFTQTVTALMRMDSVAKNFSELTEVTSYMVDRKGTVLAHSDSVKALNHENLSALGIVQDFLGGKTSLQREYSDPATKAELIGAFKTVGFAGLGVVAEVPKTKAFEGALRVRRQSLLAAMVILFLSFMVGNFFSSRTITGPILVLADAAHRIAQGDFKISLKPRAKDEIGDLSLTFNEMAAGLVERDKVKEVFNKFHNEAITSKLLSGDVKLGGERLKATIFFSDVRGFTSLSESMQPEEVVEMLNEYMTSMVSIIHAHKGVVDKYVGDAIMALWGVPIATPEDTANALRACIEMRRELERLNAKRIARNQPPLKIGMGLNRGEVIAGNIGSNERMEYTVIGDTVNVASRIESMTKEYGTDLLISRSVRDQVEGKFLFETCKSAMVKGKAEALEIFKIQGLIEGGQPVYVKTPYSEYASEKSDKAVHAPEAEEEEIDVSSNVRKVG